MAAGVSGRSVLITGTGIIGLMAVNIARAAERERSSPSISTAVVWTELNYSVPMSRSIPAMKIGRSLSAKSVTTKDRKSSWK